VHYWLLKTEPDSFGIDDLERAFDANHHHHDPDSDPKNPRWYVVDVKLVRRLPRVITLGELREHAKKELSGMVLLRPGNRLSVMPVTAEHWKFITSMLSGITK
jgi:predicted RNA-binding protein with PUA-like domain